MQKLLLFTLSLLFLSCGESSKKEPVKSQEEETTTIDQKSLIGRNNYAVTWKWATNDTQFVQDNLPTITEELTNLWKDGVVENAYYDTEAPVDKLDYLANIAFFIKAHSEDHAKDILDGLTIVKKDIATYELHPVGLLWLDRKSDVISEKGWTKSFVTIWTTNEQTADMSDEVVQNQNDAMLELWKKGMVENAYFDIEGTQISNKKADFVFFVNANTREEAEAICNSLPFYKNNIATYDMHQAGVFWMGRYTND